MENTEKLTLPEQLDYVIDNLFDNISAGKDLDNIERFIYDFYKGVELKISLSAALSDPSILKERKPITATETKLNTEVNESPKSKPKKSKKNTEEKTMEELEEKSDITKPHQQEQEEIDITQPPMPEQQEMRGSAFYDCPRCKQNKGKALVPNYHKNLCENSLVCSECKTELESLAKSQENNGSKLPPEEVEKIFENYITGIASKVDGYDEARKASVKDYIIQTINSGKISVKLQQKGWEIINKIDPVSLLKVQQAVKIKPVSEGGCEFCTAPEGPIQKRICSNEHYNGTTMCEKCYNAFVDNKSVVTEPATLDEAIDKLEEPEKQKQLHINNSDVPETSEEDKEKDAIFAANPILQQAICDQFKTISLASGITEETFDLWAAFLKLNINEAGIITDTTRLMAYVQNQSDIKYFADRFNERLQAAKGCTP